MKIILSNSTNIIAMMQDTITKPEGTLKTQSFTDKEIAERATIQSFLNCYLRESNASQIIAQTAINTDTDIVFTEVMHRTGTDSLFCCTLKHQCLRLLIGIKYWSATGRSRFRRDR